MRSMYCSNAVGSSVSVEWDAFAMYCGCKLEVRCGECYPACFRIRFGYLLGVLLTEDLPLQANFFGDFRCPCSANAPFSFLLYVYSFLEMALLTT